MLLGVTISGICTYVILHLAQTIVLSIQAVHFVLSSLTKRMILVWDSLAVSLLVPEQRY